MMRVRWAEEVEVPAKVPPQGKQGALWTNMLWEYGSGVWLGLVESHTGITDDQKKMTEHDKAKKSSQPSSQRERSGLGRSGPQRAANYLWMKSERVGMYEVFFMDFGSQEKSQHSDEAQVAG